MKEFLVEYILEITSFAYDFGKRVVVSNQRHIADWDTLHPVGCKVLPIDNDIDLGSHDQTLLCHNLMK